MVRKSFMAQNQIFMECQVLWLKVTAVLKDGWGRVGVQEKVNGRNS